jgi:hypothetical protein
MPAALAVALLAGLTLGIAGPPAQDKPGRSEEVRRLIGQLDSKHYGERDEATRKLLDMEQDALPALRRVLDSASSLEFRRRVEHIVGVFRERQRQRDRAAAITKGKRVAVDLLVERLVLRGKAASADDWQAVGDLARAMTLWAGDKTGQPDQWFIPLEADFLQSPLWTLETWKWKESDSIKALGKRIVVGADSTVSMADGSVIICRRNLRVYLSVVHAVLLLNGDLKLESIVGNISESVIFCDGDVKTERIRRSVIIATGKVTSNKHLTKDSVIVEKAGNPLPFLKLFESADVGVEVASADNGVQVKQVRPGSPFAKAGVRAEDRITALGETPVGSAEQFRRLLRGKVAARAEATVTVRRGAKDLQFRLPLSD